VGNKDLASPVRRYGPDSGRAEGQSLRTPIKPLLCQLVVLGSLFSAGLQAQVSEPPAPEGQAPQVESESTYSTGALNKYDGQTVAAIEFRGINGTDPAKLRSLLAQEEGQPLDRDKLRASIKSLYATGRFATLSVEGEAAGEGRVRLIFVVTENYFNGVITVEGAPQKGNPKAHQLVASSQLDLGDVFNEDKVVSSIQRMKKILADNGY
jgi:outer membrane protein insertion porin family